ncbi:UNKNOWN [Stylonychia lemnae]|uniref:Transmembrane protein n=1 Tax=Stylonychia lemnae TaxID=5949 RepID=A0A077ZWH9_STYLE|nr:UNKNOWN [Stylonychia lemnae]|eukprot:CDW73630.1 UNKNOWN [Stylonychia lemnae]
MAGYYVFFDVINYLTVFVYSLALGFYLNFFIRYCGVFKKVKDVANILCFIFILLAFISRIFLCIIPMIYFNSHGYTIVDSLQSQQNPYQSKILLVYAESDNQAQNFMNYAMIVNAIRWITIVMKSNKSIVPKLLLGLLLICFTINTIYYFYDILQITVGKYLFGKMTKEEKFIILLGILLMYVGITLALAYSMIYLHGDFKNQYIQSKQFMNDQDLKDHKKNKTRMKRFFKYLIAAILVKGIPLNVAQMVILMQEINLSSKIFSLWLVLTSVFSYISELLVIFIISKSIVWTLVTFDKYESQQRLRENTQVILQDIQILDTEGDLMKPENGLNNSYENDTIQKLTAHYSGNSGNEQTMQFQRMLMDNSFSAPTD